MTFSQSVSSVFSKYATFEGRAARSEYWWFFLFCILASMAAGILDVLLFGDYSLWRYGDAKVFTPIASLVHLAVFIPSIAVSARRFHDMDRTAWWLLAALTVIGTLVIFFWFMVRGTPGPNRFGPDPLG